MLQLVWQSLTSNASALFTRVFIRRQTRPSKSNFIQVVKLKKSSLQMLKAYIDSKSDLTNSLKIIIIKNPLNSYIQIFHLQLRKPSIHKSLKVARAFCGVILQGFLLLFSTLDIHSWPTQDGILAWMTCDMTQYGQTCVFISYFQRKQCIYNICLLYPFKEVRDQNIKNQSKSLIYIIQLPILQCSHSCKQRFKQFTGKKIFSNFTGSQHS